jgi:hypothetical protein
MRIKGPLGSRVCLKISVAGIKSIAYALEQDERLGVDADCIYTVFRRSNII